MNYSENLLAQLHVLRELYDLDIVETEELTAWESMETENPSQNSVQAMRTLASGFKASSTITDKAGPMDLVITASMLAEPNVRHAAVIRKTGKSPRIVVHIGRPQPAF